MLTIQTIIGNIKKGQSAIKLKAVLSNLEKAYQQTKPNIKIVGCKKDDSKITVYLTTPSTSTPGVVYDTVLELHTVKKLDVNTPFKAYSNSPSFLYNFSYVFHHQGSLLFSDLVPADFKRLSPRTRNPYMFVGFSKDIFSAVRYVSDYGLQKIVSEYDGVIPDIKSFQQKMIEIKNTRDAQVVQSSNRTE